MTPEEHHAREWLRTFYPQKPEPPLKLRFSIGIMLAFIGMLTLACTVSEPHPWLLEIIPEEWPHGFGAWCDWLGETLVRGFVLFFRYGIAQVIVDTEKHRK